MHIKASGTATFKVNETNEVIKISASDLDWECDGDGERGMGLELVHSAEFDIGSHTVTWSVWEYPVGAENHSDTDVPTSLTMVTNINFGLVHDSE